MSRAENRALEAFPIKIDGDSRGSYDLNVVKRIIYQQGYDQAEKDLELSWNDVALILNVAEEFNRKNTVPISDEEYFKEVLKRFKDYKK